MIGAPRELNNLRDQGLPASLALERRVRMLRTAMGPDIAKALDDPDVVEVMLNPDGSLWVMGDNRGDSADSRAHQDGPGHGFVPTDLVVGKVVALVWPLGRATILHRPADFAGIPDPK